MTHWFIMRKILLNKKGSEAFIENNVFIDEV